MSIKVISIKCPDCGASLPVEEGREKLFCSYCGAKIIVTNESEHIYRHIDEAEIKKIETEQKIRMKELELEEKEDARSRRVITAGYLTALAFALIGVLIRLLGVDYGYMGLFIALLIAEFTFIASSNHKDKQHEAKMIRSGKIRLDEETASFERKNFDTVSALYRAMGFTNVEAINMKNLRTSLIKTPGSVSSVTINGAAPETNKWYDATARVVIKYNGLIK